jgi:hypothetical protein
MKNFNFENLTNLNIEKNQGVENKEPTLEINEKYFYCNPLLYITFPDFEIFKRNLNQNISNMSLLNKYREVNIVNEYAQESSQDIKSTHSKSINENNISRGCFYRCRKLGIITRYDKELFDSFNSSALLTLFYGLFSVKILTSSLIEGKYIFPKSEIRCYFISFLFILSGSLIYLYRKKNELDLNLDKKYIICNIVRFTK